MFCCNHDKQKAHTKYLKVSSFKDKKISLLIEPINACCFLNCKINIQYFNLILKYKNTHFIVFI